MSSNAPLFFFARVDFGGGLTAASDSPSSSTAGVTSFAFRFEPLVLDFAIPTASLPLGSSVSAIEEVVFDLEVAAFREGSRAGVFVVFAVRERVLLPRFSSWPSESASRSGALAIRARVGFGVCRATLDAVLRTVFFLSGSSVILAVKKGHSAPRLAFLRRCSSLVTLALLELTIAVAHTQGRPQGPSR